MNTIDQCRTDFGRTLKGLRTQQNLSQRQLQDLSGVVYTLISAHEHGERAIGSGVATKLADALGLDGEERERFLFAAAATRRKDRLVGYSRTLAPELLNFVPMVLAGAGVNLGNIDACEVRGDFLLVNTGGKEYRCTLQITPMT